MNNGTDMERIADPSPLKRSFDIIHKSHFYADLDHDEEHDAWVVQPPNLEEQYGRPRKRPSISTTRPSHLSMQTSSVMSDTFPSFMSVFQGQDFRINKHATNPSSSSAAKNTLCLLGHPEHPSPPQTTDTTLRSHQHRNSTASNISDSSQSSPSTSDSILDSPALTEPSPSSSPESPTSVLPLSPFRSTMLSSESKIESNESIKLSTPDHQPMPARSNSPSSETRNPKNLTLNMTVIPAIRPSTSMGIETSEPFSAPTSPLKEPLRTGRRKPTNLTIRTPGFQQLNFPRPLAEIPPTPSTRPPLQHYKSSPSLASLASPTLPRKLFLPIPVLNTDIEPRPPTQSLTQTLPELREEDDTHLQRSKEAPERGYPGGPVQIYDCGVWLYLEPTSEEASKFDTVINVAKEIKNPFMQKMPESNTVVSIWRSGPQGPNIQEPQTAISEVSFKSAFEWPVYDQTPTPTTPKTSSTYEKTPEYLHVQWDHNSEILEDLYPLCKLVDDRVQAGKKVLIHCQLGVSRSASLVIAYGLYKGYQPDFHSMYMAVKQKSQWVGPNMSLIYQLNDFRSRVARGDYTTGGVAPKDAWFLMHGDHNNQIQTPVAEPITPPKAESKSSSQDTPRVLEENDRPKHVTPLRLDKELPPLPQSLKADVPPNLVSAPQNDQSATVLAVKLAEERLSTTSIADQKDLAEVPKSANKPTPLPLRERRDLHPGPIPAFKPGLSHVPGLSFSSTSSHMDLASQNEPSTPSIFSPRAAEFMASPFGITKAGDLASAAKKENTSWFASIFGRKPISNSNDLSSTVADPRSPHQRNDNAEITRSIDDVI